MGDCIARGANTEWPYDYPAILLVTTTSVMFATIMFLVMVMVSASIVMARTIAIYYGATQILLQQLLNVNGWSSGMNLNTQLIQHIDGTCTKTSAQYICTGLCGDELWHCTMLMFRSIKNN